MAGNYNIIVVTGPTATGKTNFAVQLARKFDGEIISADSRQVYRGMSLGSGKDLNDYVVDGKIIPYHCIDIADAGKKYNVFEFQRDFLHAFLTIENKGKTPILCGGTGMYIEAVLSAYKLIQVPPNDILREELEKYTLDELAKMLSKMKKLHNKSDVDTKKRAIRGIEIETYYLNHPAEKNNYPEIKPFILALHFDREVIRKRITTRLKQRFADGMLDEAKTLLNSGLKSADLEYYGLEYKFMAQHLSGQITYQQMFDRLNTAIHQFAKRQMTWFRRMERNGFKINWIDGNLNMEGKIALATRLYTEK